MRILFWEAGKVVVALYLKPSFSFSSFVGPGPASSSTAGFWVCGISNLRSAPDSSVPCCAYSSFESPIITGWPPADESWVPCSSGSLLPALRCCRRCRKKNHSAAPRASGTMITGTAIAATGVLFFSAFGDGEDVGEDVGVTKTVLGPSVI